jgi:hypothetical protein
MAVKRKRRKIKVPNVVVRLANMLRTMDDHLSELMLCGDLLSTTNPVNRGGAKSQSVRASRFD